MRVIIKKTTVARPLARNVTEREKKDPVKDMLPIYRKMITRPCPKSRNKGGIQVTPIYIIGGAGSGKTTLSKKSSDDIKEAYELDELQTIYCKCKEGIDPQIVLDLVLSKIEDKKVVWIFFDDVHYLEGKKDYKELLDFQANVRHLYSEQICKQRQIVILPGTEAMDYVDTGLVGYMLIFQVKYKVNPRVRSQCDISIVFKHSAEKWYSEQEKQIYGSEVVLKGLDRNFEIYIGNYEEIGEGTILLPAGRGETAGTIKYKLEENDTRKLNEIFDTVINLDHELAQTTTSRTPGGKSVISTVVPAGKSWDGLIKIFVRNFLNDSRLTDYYINGVPNKEGKIVWALSDEKTPKYHQRFIIIERLMSWIYLYFYKFDKRSVTAKMNIRRDNAIKYKGLKIRRDLKPRTLEEYAMRFTTFFKPGATRTFMGDVMEKFLCSKLNSELKDCFDHLEEFETDRKELIEFFVGSSFETQRERCDIVLLDKNGFYQSLISVKYSDSHVSSYEITPEDSLAKERGLSLGFLLIDQEDELPIIRFMVQKPSDIEPDVDVYKPDKSFESFREVLFTLLYVSKQVLEEKEVE